MSIQERPITLGLIGAGHWGKNFLETTRNLPHIRIKYVCAKTQTTLDSLPSEYIKTTDYKDFFKFSLDGVIIATPASTHLQIATEFLKKNYNLFIEKSVTATLHEAITLQELWNMYNKAVILVGHIQVYNPAYTQLKKEVPEIGNVKELTYTGLQSQPRTDVPVIKDWGPHPVSIFLDFTGTSPNTVFAQYTSSDNIHLELEFPNNIVGKADIGWTAPKRVRRFSVIGTGGSLVIDTASPIQGSTPLAEEIKEFAECIRSGCQPKTDLAQAVEIMKILELAQESANNGGRLLKFKKV